MLEIFQEAHVAHLQADAPGTGVGHVAIVESSGRGPSPVAVTKEGGEVAAGRDGGHALGAVLGIAVVTGSIPAEYAGGTPVHLVLDQSLGNPALAAGVEALIVAVAITDRAAAHAFQEAVVEVDFDVQRIPEAQLDRNAGPEGAGIGMAASKIAIGTPAVAVLVAVQHVGCAIVVVTAEGILADDTVHDPGRGLYAVKGQGQGQGEEVHVVEVSGLVVVVAAPICSIVVIVGTGPEAGQTHIFGELIGEGYGSHIVVQDGRATGGIGHGHALQAHAELEIGVRHGPVDVGALYFDDLGVGTKGTAAAGLAPGGVTDFEEDCAGQALGGHGIDLQADTLGSRELVIVVHFFHLPIAFTGFIDQAAFATGKAHQPLAGSLEVDGLSAIGCREDKACSQNKSHKTFHWDPPQKNDNAFIVKGCSLSLQEKLLSWQVFFFSRALVAGFCKTGAKNRSTRAGSAQCHCSLSEPCRSKKGAARTVSRTCIEWACVCRSA